MKKPSDDIKPEEAKGDEVYFDKVDRPPSTKLSNDMEYSHSEETKTIVANHCVKSVQIQNFFWFVFSRIRTEYGEIRSLWFIMEFGL